MHQTLQALEPAIVGIGLGKGRAQPLGHVAQSWGLECSWLDISDVGCQTCFLPLCYPRDLTIERYANVVIAEVGIELLRRLTCRIRGLALGHPIGTHIA